MFGFLRNYFQKRKETEEERHKPRFNASPKDVENEYIKLRLERFIRFFDKQKELNRRKEQCLQYSIIGLGALIPIINVIGIEKLYSNISSAIFGGTIAAVTAVLQFEKYHERWQDAKRTSSKLTREYYEWKNSSGEYSLKDDEIKKQLEERINKLMGQHVEKPEKEKSQDKPETQKIREQLEKEMKLGLLVKRCEEIIISEAFDYVALFSPTNVSPPH